MEIIGRLLRFGGSGKLGFQGAVKYRYRVLTMIGCLSRGSERI